MANTNIPTAYGDKQDDWKRRQAIIDAMGAQALQAPQGRQAGRLFVAPSPLEGIAKVFQAYMANKGETALGEEKAADREAYDTETRKALDAYTTGRQTDPRQAAIEAIMSQDPRLRALGQGDLEAAAKGAIQPKDLLPHQNPLQIPDLLTRGTQGFSPKRDITFVDGIPVDKTTVPTGFVLQDYTDVRGNAGQINPLTGKRDIVDKAPKTTISVNANPVVMGQRAGMSEYFKNAAKQVDALGERANSSQNLLNTIDTLRQLSAEGINSNLTSDMATTMQNLGQALGVKVDATKLGNTEAYNSLIVDLWQRAVSQYGGNRGVTQSEAEEIKKLTPMARYSPEAREKLFAIQSQAAERSIAAYQQANQSFAEAAAADDPKLFQIPGYIQGAYTPQAARPSGGQGEVMSLDDYLKAQGAR